MLGNIDIYKIHKRFTYTKSMVDLVMVPNVRYNQGLQGLSAIIGGSVCVGVGFVSLWASPGRPECYRMWPHSVVLQLQAGEGRGHRSGRFPRVIIAASRLPQFHTRQ